MPDMSDYAHEAKPMPFVFGRFQVPGDIVFVQTRKKIPFNRMAQTAVSRRRARYTHVLLCVMPGLYIHSIPHKGVHFIAAEDDEANFPEHYGDRLAVRRNTQLTNNVALAGQIPWKAQYFIGQKYNGAFGGAARLAQLWRDSHSFCSELIARIYQDLGISVCDLAPEHVLPVHLDNATKSGQWIDVTSLYVAYFRGELASDPLHRLLDEMIPMPDIRPPYMQTVETIIKSARSRGSAKRSLNDAHDFIKAVPEVIEKMSDKDKEQIATDVGINMRSFRSVRTALLNQIFQLDKALVAANRGPITIKTVHWTDKAHAPVKQLDVKPLVAQLADVQNLNTAAVATLIGEDILEAIESVVMMVAGPSAHEKITPEQEAIIVQWTESLRNLIAASQDFEDYGADLDALDIELLRRLQSEGLLTKEMRLVLRSFARELQCRRALHRAWQALEVLRKKPVDFDSWYQVYQNLLELAHLDVVAAAGNLGTNSTTKVGAQ